MSNELPPCPHLEPCPFCGKEPDVVWRLRNPRASCKTEGCFGTKSSVINLDYESDVAAWNTRAALAAVPQEPTAYMYADDFEKFKTSEASATVWSIKVGSSTRGETTVCLYAQPSPQAVPLEPSADQVKIEELTAKVQEEIDIRKGYKARMVRAETILRKTHGALADMLFGDEFRDVPAARSACDDAANYFAGDL